MKLTLLIVLLLVQCDAFSQENPYAKVDEYAASIPPDTPLDALSLTLTAPFHSDSEKVRSIFYWITQNISYDVYGFHHKQPMIFEHSDSMDSAGVAAYFQLAYARKALAERKAVCEEYAALFKELCDRAGLKCEVVHGIAKNGCAAIGRQPPESHAWNAVMIDSAWKVIDICWASGYCDDAVTRFYKKFNEYYYCTPPELFIYDHYPTNGKWLLTKPVPRDIFVNFPCLFRQNAHTICNYFSPASGILKNKLETP